MDDSHVLVGTVAGHHQLAVVRLGDRSGIDDPRQLPGIPDHVSVLGRRQSGIGEDRVAFGTHDHGARPPGRARAGPPQESPTVEVPDDPSGAVSCHQGIGSDRPVVVPSPPQGSILVDATGIPPFVVEAGGEDLPVRIDVHVFDEVLDVGGGQTRSVRDPVGGGRQRRDRGGQGKSCVQEQASEQGMEIRHTDIHFFTES